MTREEQLDWLYRLKSGIYVYMPKEWLIPMNNALDMAIKAFEQEPKTGHWIKIVVNGQHKIKCDKCDYTEPEYATYIRNYCPNCGAEMIEPQESEESND